jgi:hypothetical protein
MANLRFRGAVGFLVAGSMVFCSTAAIASAPAPQQVAPWAALTALTGGAPAAALCGSAVAAAQAPSTGCVLPAVDVAPPVAQAAPPPPIPVPPVEAPAAGFGVSPILLALAAIAAGVGLYFLLKKKNSNSPA